MQKSCFLGPTILEILQPNWYQYTYIALKQEKVEIMQWPQFFQLNWESIAHVSIWFQVLLVSREIKLT